LPDEDSIETVTIDTIGHKGDGVAMRDGMPLFVPGSLPGERLRVAVTGDRGRILDILEASPERTVPPCPHFGTCGGCALQHWTGEAYLDLKRASLQAALADRGIETEVGPIVACPPRSRRRAVIAVQQQENRLVAGFRERLSHKVAEIHGCHVVTPAIEAALPGLVRVAAMLAFDKKGAIFTVIDSETGLDVAVSEATLPAARRQDVITLALALGFARLSIGGEVIVVARAPVVHFGGVPVALPPGGFLQAVQECEEALGRLVVEAVGGARKVADLFAGSGTFTLRLARTAQVHAVEADRAALDALDKAWRFAAGLKAVSVETRDLFRRPVMAKELDRFDAVVFDPPRDGAAAQAKEIAKSKVPIAVAVSCNPATLARDGHYLIDAGYRLKTVTPVDQFLWSHHVEAVAVFRRGG
jgi:23S rRNA (uracil1939-C5)-methyltransferase